VAEKKPEKERTNCNEGGLGSDVHAVLLLSANEKPSTVLACDLVDHEPKRKS
jgi:hypothetical protein